MKIIIVIILIALFLATLKMSAACLIGIVKAYKAKSWSSVEGLIIKSMSVAQLEGGDEIEIEFQYEINNKTYKSNTPYYGPTNLVGELQNKFILNAYKKDSTAKVFYNHNNPNEATLITGINKLQFEAIGLLLLIGSFSSLFGVLALIIGLSIEF